MSQPIHSRTNYCLRKGPLSGVALPSCFAPCPNTKSVPLLPTQAIILYLLAKMVTRGAQNESEVPPSQCYNLCLRNDDPQSIRDGGGRKKGTI